MGCSSWSMTLIYSISWAIMSWFCIVLLSTSALQVRVFLSYLALNKPEGSWSTKELYFYVVVVQSLSHVRFYDTMARSTQDCPALYYLPESVQIHIHWKYWYWSWSSNNLATWYGEPTHWKRPWCWERLRAGGEGDDRGWDGWMASLTQWTWVWACSRT